MMSARRLLNLCVAATMLVGALMLATLSMRHALAAGVGLSFGAVLGRLPDSRLRQLIAGVGLLCLVGAFLVQVSVGWALGMAGAGSTRLARVLSLRNSSGAEDSSDAA